MNMITAMAFPHVARSVFNPFMLWIFSIPISESSASITMPTPAPK